MIEQGSICIAAATRNGFSSSDGMVKCDQCDYSMCVVYEITINRTFDF